MPVTFGHQHSWDFAAQAYSYCIIQYRPLLAERPWRVARRVAIDERPKRSASLSIGPSDFPPGLRQLPLRLEAGPKTSRVCKDVRAANEYPERRKTWAALDRGSHPSSE